MFNEQNELPFIHDPTYKYLFKRMSDSYYKIPFLRRNTGTTSCRLSTLFYTIIALHWGTVKTIFNQAPDFIERNSIHGVVPSVVNNLVRELNEIVRLCVNDGNIDAFIAKNYIKDGVIVNENIEENAEENTKSIDNIFSGENPRKIYTFGLVANNISIAHYFTVIQLAPNEFSVISSYACDTVDSPQQQIPILKQELKDFIQNLNKNENENEEVIARKEHFIKEFLTKFFLQSGNVVRFVDKDSGSKPIYKNIQPEIGAENECIYIIGLKKIQVMYFPNFVDDVDRIIEQLQQLEQLRRQVEQRQLEQQRIDRNRAKTKASHKTSRQMKFQGNRIIGGSKMKTHKLKKTMKRRKSNKKKKSLKPVTI